MKRFTVAVIGGEETLAPWLDTGYGGFVPGNDETGRPLRPDVLCIAPDEKGWEGTAAALWPKVAVVAGPSPRLPAEMTEAYRLFYWRPGGLSFTVASRLDAALTEPLWLDYGPQELPSAAKAVADTVYRHLLSDVFRDTAEWCGHTFSVVTGI